MSISITQGKIRNPPSHRIFVFGSNMAGRHGKGAALHAARFYGAESGIAIGHHNQCYAIPTKDRMLRSLSIGQIQHFVSGFIEYANRHPNLQFDVTKIGCGLAGYHDEEIAPMFERAPLNCYFDSDWLPHFRSNKNYWIKRP